MRVVHGAVGAALCAAALASCGGGKSESPLDDALGYLPADAPLAIAVSSDLDGAQYQHLDAALQRFGVEGGLDSALEDVQQAGVSFAQIKPLLGEDLVVGVSSATGATDEPAQIVVALPVDDPDAARDVLDDAEGLEPDEDIDGATAYRPAPPTLPPGVPESSVQPEGPEVAVDDDVVVAAGSRVALEEAIHQHDAGDRLTEDEFVGRLADLPRDGLVRATGNVPGALGALGAEAAGSVPWIDSLESFGVVASLGERSLTVDATLNGRDVDESELPVAAGPDSPPVARERPSVANRDQSQSIEFALDVVRALVPKAAYAEVTRRLGEELGSDASSLARQFGEGLVVELPGQTTATRSEIRHPAVVARALDALKEEVPRLARAEAPGDLLDAARFLIPALPVPESGQYFPPGSKVREVPGEPDLYRLLAPKPEVPAGTELYEIARSEFVFGLIDDVFVTAPSVRAARGAAGLDPVALDLPPGAVAVHAPLSSSDLGFPAPGGPGVTVTTIKAGLDAETGAVRLELHASL